MFILSFIFVIACGLFEWKRICTILFFLYRLFICVLRSSYQEGRIFIPLAGLTTPHLCVCPKAGPEFPTSMSWYFCVCAVNSVKMRDFVDIGGIDDLSFHNEFNYYFLRF